MREDNIKAHHEESVSSCWQDDKATLFLKYKAFFNWLAFISFSKRHQFIVVSVKFYVYESTGVNNLWRFKRLVRKDWK